MVLEDQLELRIKSPGFGSNDWSENPPIGFSKWVITVAIMMRASRLYSVGNINDVPEWTWFVNTVHVLWWATR